MDAPQVIGQYLAAADAGDTAALAACFTEAGTVVDEDVRHEGRAEIVGWREELSGKYTYTTTVTGSEPSGDGGYRVTVRVEGDFPGGVADLGYDFVLDGGLISSLRIG